jgi:hypothetical protein
MLVAIDPGLSTGIAFRFDNGAWGTVTVIQTPDPLERLHMVLSTIVERLHKDSCEAIIVEAFITMGYLSKYGIETIELVGALKTLGYLWSVPLVKQAPIQRMPMERTAAGMLKERGIKYSDHEISALSHLLVYERIHNPVTANPEPTGPRALPPVGTGLVKTTRKAVKSNEPA